MGSVTCARCGFVSFATSEVCKQCGGPLPGPVAPNRRPQPPPGWQPQGATDWHQQQAAGNNWPPPHGGSAQYQSQPGHYGTDDGLPKRKGTALVSLLCGLLALPVMIVGAVAAISLGAPAAILGGLVGLLMTLLSLILGIVGIVWANKNPSEFGGKGMAIAGVVLGSLLLVSVIPVGIVAAIAVPNLMAARQAANEAAAVGSLRAISQAEFTYQSTAGKGEFGDLEDLSRESLLPEGMAVEVRNGYRFELNASGNSYELTATPVDYPNSGKRSFYTSEIGLIRGADKRGKPADADDPPIDINRQAGLPPGSREGEIEWTEDSPILRGAYSPSRVNR